MFQLCYIDAFTNSVNHTQAKVVNKVLYYPAVKGHVHIAHTPRVAHAQATTGSIGRSARYTISCIV
jgi:hypothetical protein